MTRPLRLDCPGALHPVTARGDRREPIVDDDADRFAWVDLLSQVSRRFGWRVQAWVLMSNHHYQVLETSVGRLSPAMPQLASQAACLALNPTDWTRRFAAGL